MKNVIPVIVLFCTINVGYSLKCYNCRSSNFNGHKEECEPIVETCDTKIFNNGTSCITITYETSGITGTYKGCYYKMKQPTGVLSSGSQRFIIKDYYTTCDGELCNASENLKKSFNVCAIAGVLFVLSKLL